MEAVRCLHSSSRRPARYCAAVTSHFRLPEQGMETFEVLARATAFPVRFKAGPAARPSLHWLVSKHVVAPFEYTHSYYAAEAEWLSFVEPKHIKVTLEFRDDETGAVVWEGDCDGAVRCHEQLDVASVYLNNDAEAALESLANETVSIEPLELVDKGDDETALGFDDALVLGGHVLDGIAADDPTVSPRPIALPARFVGTGSDGARHFVRTEEPLTMGICGGPVLAKTSALCVGMVEGMIQDETSELNVGAFIGRRDLAEFLTSVETQWEDGVEE